MDDEENRPQQGLDDPMDDGGYLFTSTDPPSPGIIDFALARLNTPIPLPEGPNFPPSVRRWSLVTLPRPYNRYGDEEDEEEDGETRQQHTEAGVDLLMSGDFGPVGNKMRSRRNMFNAAQLLGDYARSRRPTYKEDLASNLVPNSHGTTVASYWTHIYCGQFSEDASMYYTCGQDFRLHVYDMAAPRKEPPEGGNLFEGVHKTTMGVINIIHGHRGNWTISDSHLSPDNERLIYSSLTPTVYMTSTRNPNPVQVPISFADPPNRLGSVENFFIGSCRFSADGNEVIAGGQNHIYVYDLLAARRTMEIPAHQDDVNSCCWADSTSGNVLVSASDDTFIKVWDRRSLGTFARPSGVFVGHTEGVTFVSPKGDGRYVISNGKDQVLKLWDLRKMCSNQDFDMIQDHRFGIPHYDYRYSIYPKRQRRTHPDDCSLMSYYGHTVARTLIRCHFSPAETTGSQYLYSGSSNGKIHIWSLDGRVVQILDRARTLSMNYDPSEPDPPTIPDQRGLRLVRDVSWSSQEPVIMSAAWENHQRSSIARHEWKGLSKSYQGLEDWVEKHNLENVERASQRRRLH